MNFPFLVDMVVFIEGCNDGKGGKNMFKPKKIGHSSQIECELHRD